MYTGQFIRHLCTTFLLVFACSSVTAQQSGLYYGAAATLQDAETALNRTVQSQVNLVDLPDTQLTRTTSGKEKPLQWDALVGYRFNVADQTQFFSIQAELSLLGDDINTRLTDDMETPGQQLFGQTWERDWKIETSRSIGIVTKYGFNRQLFKVIDLSIYGLVGARRTHLDFFSSFLGCYQTDGCSVDELRLESTRVDPEVNMLIGGVGTEIHLGLKTAIQLEMRAVGETSSEWETELKSGDETFISPVTLEQSGTDFSMKLIRYM